MLRFSLILFLAVVCLAIGFTPVVRAAETAEVVYDDGRPGERVPLFRISGEDDVWFVRASDVARLFHATQFWNASTRKIVLGVGKTRLVLTVDTRVVVVDGEPFMMRSSVRYEDGFVMVPLEFLLEIAAEHTPRTFRWDDETRRLSVLGGSFNVTRIDVTGTAAQTRAIIALTEPLVYHVDSGTPGLVRLKIYGGRSERPLTLREARGLLRAVRTEQTERDMFVTFDISRDVRQLRVDRNDSPPQIVLMLEKGTSAEADSGMVVLDEGAKVRQSLLIDKVCIDAGHGGRDNGHENGDIAEKDVTLAIANVAAERIRDELGLEVVMTREDDSMLGLDERTEIANRSGADLFISIHCNSWFNDKTGGVESYFLSPARGEPGVSLARFENDKASGGASGLEFVLWDVVQNAYISQSSSLAEAIQRELATRLQIKSRGVKQGNFVVLQGARMPAVLIETAFLSNPAEAQKLKDPDFHRRVADGLVASIRRMQEQYR